jgi:hypothetical protein
MHRLKRSTIRGLKFEEFPPFMDGWKKSAFKLLDSDNASLSKMVNSFNCKSTSLTNPSAVRHPALWHSAQKLSALQRWIMIQAYAEIVESGSDEPKKYRRTGYLPPVHLLRIKVLRDYFHIPLRTQRSDYGHKWLVIDNATAGLEKANAARTSLSRSLRRLKERGLISDSIRLTLRGIEVAQALSAKTVRRPSLAQKRVTLRSQSCGNSDISARLVYRSSPQSKQSNEHF